MAPDEGQKRIDNISEQLQAKIRGLQSVSTFLAGFAFTVLGLEIGRLWGDGSIPFWIFFSIPLMLFAVVLYIYAVMKLTGLAMPKPFRVEDERNRELSDAGFREQASSTPSELRQLKDEMVFYWRWLTILATCLVAGSLLVMLFPVTTAFSPDLLRYTTFVSSIVSVLLAVSYCAYIRKRWPKRLQHHTN